MDAGKLVDDAIVLGIIRERLAEPDARSGFMLDGFPRNLAQAEALGAHAGGRSASRSTPWCCSRSTTPRSCVASPGAAPASDCGRVFNIYTSPPGTPPHCDRCADKPELVQRPDDNEATVARRLEVYDEQTRPLIDHYRALSLLRTIAAARPVDAVTADLVALLDTLGGTVELPALGRKAAIAEPVAQAPAPAARIAAPVRPAAKKAEPAARQPAKKVARKPARKASKKAAKKAAKKPTRKPARKAAKAPAKKTRKAKKPARAAARRPAVRPRRRTRSRRRS